MQTRCHFPLLFVLFLLISCSGQVFSEPLVTQQPSAKPEITALATTPNIVDATSTHTSTPIATTEIPSTQTPTLVDLENLPKLNEVVISSLDFETIELSYNPLILVTDATNELQGSCLWDCVKYRYSLEHGTLTIVLLRTGDRQKAESTLDNLKKDFLTVSRYEYTVEDLTNMPPRSWALVDMASSTDDHQTGAAGIAHGSVVILVTYSQIWSDDLMEFAYVPVYFLNEQIRKLESAGYPR